ncbi:MAG: hypothetical protein MK102_04100 [Fuerstiella sp.]|nr:hypothetical protein [Fuerstiella sp.]
MTSDSQDNPEELLSAQFDGEFTGDLNASDELKLKLENEWTVVRTQIQSLPVKSVDLVQTVNSDFGHVSRPKSIKQRRSWNAWVTMGSGVAAIVVMFGYIALQLMQSVDSNRRSVNVVEFRKTLSELSKHHPDSASCNLVVVNIADDAGVEASVREMLGAAEQRGAEITSLHSEVDGGAEYSAGFLMTAGSESQVVLDSLADQQERLELNPENIDGRSQEEIRAMFLAAMRVPTKSDKVFGVMYVVDESELKIFMEPLPSDVRQPSRSRSVALPKSKDVAFDGVPPEAVQNSFAVTTSGEFPSTMPLIVIFRKRVSVREVTPDADPEQGQLWREGLFEPAV